jgi:hypothetical protein
VNDVVSFIDKRGMKIDNTKDFKTVRSYIMKAVKRKVSDMTVDELKSVVHDVIAEDMETWRETLEIMADKNLMGQIRQADRDRAAKKKGAFVSWDNIKNA